MVCLRNICINTLHKGDNDDDDGGGGGDDDDDDGGGGGDDDDNNNNDNNNNECIHSVHLLISLYISVPHLSQSQFRLYNH